MNKHNICENRIRVEYEKKVRDKVILNNKYVQKYKTPYKGPYEITRMWTNGMVTLKMNPAAVIYNICYINPHKSETDVYKCPSVITSYIPLYMIIIYVTCLENLL